MMDATEAAVMIKHPWVHGCAGCGIYTAGHHKAIRRIRIPMHATTDRQILKTCNETILTQNGIYYVSPFI